MVVQREGQVVGRVPVEDIGVLILDSMTTTYTHAVLAGVLAAGAVIIPCDSKHLPAALFLDRFGERPLHVVAAVDVETSKVYVITAYEPTLEHFEPDFRRRK